jgi:hypothetical protein
VVAWRRELGPELGEARSWSDLAVRLQVHGVHLEARGRGLVVTDGEVYVKASSIGREYSRGRLEERFGQGFAEWRAVRERFGAAAETYVRYAHRGVGHKRAGAALRALRSAGESLGWRAAGRLAGPLAPAVGAVLMAGARAEARGGSRAAWDGLLADRVAPALRRSTSWAEAEGRLRFHGVWIGPEGSGRGGGRGGLMVTDGVHSTRLGELGADLGRARLDGRLGSWVQWQDRRRELLGQARRLGRLEATVEVREDRWRRLIGLIQTSELRAERHESLRSELRVIEGRLRRQLRPRLQRGAGEAELSRLLREVRSLPERELAARLRGGRWGVLSGWRRREEFPEELRRVVRDYRELTRHVIRSAPAARSASRRLPQLRRRAQIVNPVYARGRIREGLARTARQAGGIGVRSLLARAAPGLGSALTLVRVVRRLGRELERGDRGR